MNKWEAVHSFWSSFGVPAYDESAVPKGAGFPRLTYQAATSSFQDGARQLTASLWCYGPSWTESNQIVDDMASRIGMGGIVSLYDGGALWIKRGTNFAQRMGDPEDDMIRRIVLQIEAEFISAN